MSNKLLTVFSYGSGIGQEIVDRHYPYWQRSGCDILLSFPLNDGVRQGGIACGTSEKYGEQLIRRTIMTMRHVLKMRFDHFWFIESDAVTLGELPEPQGVEAFVYRNHDPNFWSDIYCHWGWGFTRERLQEIIAFVCANEIPSKYHHGFADRWLGTVLQMMDIVPVISGVSFSCNRIDSPELVASAKEHIANGALIIHGVKTQQDLDNIGV